jgi:hypothetical protein
LWQKKEGLQKDKKVEAQTQTSRSQWRAGQKQKKVKAVKEDSPFQTRQIVVVSHGKATQQSIQHRSYVTSIESIDQ